MPSIKLRTRSRTPVSIGSNQSSKSWALVSACECSAIGFVLLLRMAWSQPAWQRRNRLGWTTRRLRHLQFPPTPLRHPTVPPRFPTSLIRFVPRYQFQLGPRNAPATFVVLTQDGD